MEIVFILIPVSLVIVVIALWAFVWSVRNDQYDDLEKEAYRILIDEEIEIPHPPTNQDTDVKNTMQDQDRIEGSSIKQSRRTV
ncbi:MAG: cbb3-type cytochrome oxidase assembly protein CcoS [Porticoccaceae bacterium]|jgi:cbb3-type cytochrome oxidase maturation protein|nr:cbb3-type cytochrome oxidase assembly protein CcoS [Porticoccaceae bacterium]MBT4164980.1 cbb3-type cytochrome oxidase assembly protein CcoS [Porticoccaceae bacterium]MBT4591416.1 cbb3-type cytochrome oxidase assembly protein CcoS [Porticoccaceae bacterium]MBT5003245.1 cbb3-type cytochrome oxidase assembly protein CcoS [Porticoccaceae bacterium]MBT5104064.1 cbb3-type cytochrome oxidase assembly protein CcoS [Porticoccaceae bacterium]